MNVLVLIIIFIICYWIYSSGNLQCAKDGFGIKGKVKKFARLIPVNKKILIPAKNQTQKLIGKVNPLSKPLEENKTITRSILKKNKGATQHQKDKKSVWYVIIERILLNEYILDLTITLNVWFTI